MIEHEDFLDRERSKQIHPEKISRIQIFLFQENYKFYDKHEKYVSINMRNLFKVYQKT